MGRVLCSEKREKSNRRKNYLRKAENRRDMKEGRRSEVKKEGRREAR